MFKFFKWLLLDQFMLGMGGGGGGGQTTSTGTTYQTNIPEYAQPYVETMLGATQQQLFDMSGNEITGFKPYKPYSTNLNDYTAEFQPLQEQAMRNTGQLQTPGQFGDATTLAGVAGLGSLGAGQQYARNVTDPSMMQSYMSPYQQNVTDIAKMNAVREAQMAQNAQNLGAARQGTYGGARQLLAQTEREKNLLSNLSNIQATGSQSAFDRAMQAQQFGSTLGMQGYGQAGQAASTLGQLGGAQLGAQKEIIGLQSQLGAQQQALEQQKINQAIQEYANAQQYPIMQLGVMSNMLRGLPMQATQTQTYAAAPNPLTQGIGTVGALGSLANVFKGSSTSGREGGLPSEFKPATGIKSYSVGSQVKGKLYDMSLGELRDYIKETSSPIAKELAEEVLRDKVGKASGGIIAFQNRGEVEDPEMVRQAYIDAAKLQATNNPPVEIKKEFPTSVGPVNVGPTNIPSLDTVIANRQLGLPKDFPSELSYEADKARSEFQQRVIEQGGQLKPTTKFTGKSAVPMTDEQRMTGFRAALEPASDMRTKEQIIADANKQNAGVQADPNLSKEDKARLQKRHNEGVAIVKADPNIGVKPPAAAPSAAAPAPAGITTIGKSNLPAMEQIPSVSEILQQQAQYMGTTPMSKENQERQAQLMAEKANAKAEASRQTYMRMAEFFASWGSTPGSTINAGLTALKAKMPSFISDDKEQKKIIKDINNSMYELNKADRAEKAGNFKEAAEIRNKAAIVAERKYGHELTFRASEISSAATVQSALIRQKSEKSVNDRQYAVSLRSDQDLLRKIEQDWNKELEGTTYKGDKVFLSKPENETKDPEKWAAAKSRVKTKDDELEAKTRPIREQINFYRKELGLVNPVGGEGKKDTANNKLTMDGYVFPDQTSLEAYKAAKAKQKG